MHVIDIQYKNNVTNVSNIYTPLNGLLNLFSLNIHGKKNKNRYISLIKRVIPVIVYVCLNIITLYLKTTHYYVNLRVSVKYTDAVQMVYDLFQYMIDLFFVYKYRNELYTEYLKQYAYVDGLLGMDYHAITKCRLIHTLVFLILMWFGSSLCDFIIWSKGFGILIPTIFAVAYIFVLIKITTHLDLIANIMQVECRLRALGDTVLDCCRSTEGSSSFVDDFVSKKDCFYNGASDVTISKPNSLAITIITCFNKKEVKWLSECYLLLTEQVAFINKMFGMRILLNSLSLLIDMIRFTNLTVLVIIGSQETGLIQEYYAAIATIWRTFTCVFVVVSLVHNCELVYRQRERIICLLDHFIINKNLGNQQLSAFSAFRGLVQSRAISFHMAHFVRLDYPLLVSIASVVVTYTIILLQSVAT